MIMNRNQMIEMFTDATAGETYANNRLITRETENGNVALIAYGWMKLAEYDESREIITVFDGHRDFDGKTINTYLNRIIEIASERREVNVVGASPYVSRPPHEALQFVGNYINWVDGLSSVEKDALDTVIESLRDVF